MQTQLKKGQSAADDADAHRDILRHLYSRMVVAPRQLDAFKAPVRSVLANLASKQPAGQPFDQVIPEDNQFRTLLNTQVRFMEGNGEQAEGGPAGPTANSTPHKPDDRTSRLLLEHREIVQALTDSLKPAEDLLRKAEATPRSHINELIRKLGSLVLSADGELKQIVLELENKSAYEEDLNLSRHRISADYARMIGSSTSPTCRTSAPSSTTPWTPTPATRRSAAALTQPPSSKVRALSNPRDAIIQRLADLTWLPKSSPLRSNHRS